MDSMNAQPPSVPPPWESAALELGKLDYSLDFGKRCEIIQHAAEAYAAQQTAALRERCEQLERDMDCRNKLRAELAEVKMQRNHFMQKSEALQSARDECERQYQEKVAEIGALLNEWDKLAVAFEAAKTMLADVAKERDDADHDRQLAQDENAALAASVARLREVVEPMRRNFRMAHARNTDELKTLPTPYDDALDDATPPPALAPDAPTKHV
jgi:chromosome segregation ATPase